MGSLKKHVVWTVIKKEVFSKMDKNSLSAERADEILRFIFKSIKTVSDMKALGLYCTMLSRKFPELKEAINILRSQENEKMEQIVGLLLEKFINAGNFEGAEKLLLQTQKTKNIDAKINLIKKAYPKEFAEIYRNIFG